ncbi:hypothetical protein [Endozoicomonas numazuensis]|uniref:NAD/FAD-utilizing enzyme n=1 Tax=Endozoicomonas numazuensis TaxID=1137799 RepID=A0A081NF99_9GAMM|nr:hypothetical protein [Endozoicomonas numazuensis]KEQ17122.1 hypothetical protein GZ78_14705 [Endozoicomonas numazuensis]
MIRILYRLPDLPCAQKFNELVESEGVAHNRIHIAHKDHLTLQKKHLNDLTFLEEFDTVHSGERGFLVGIILTVLAGLSVYEIMEGYPVASMITLFACLVVLGYSTWLGGLIGASSDNYRLQPFRAHLDDGGSVVMLDVDPVSASRLMNVIAHHIPEAQPAGRSQTLDNPFKGSWFLRKHS